MENLELLIKQDLDDGIGMLSIAKKYGVGTSMVQKVKKQGKYYLDIKSGEIIFSAKKISFEEQAFNYLCFKYEDSGYLYTDTDSSTICSKKATSRLSVYLNVSRSQTTRWANKSQRLFEVDENGEVSDALEEYSMEFEKTEKDKFRDRQYYIDEFGLLKGYKLAYIMVSPYHLRHVVKYATLYIDYINSLNGKRERKIMYYTMCKREYADDDGKYLFINSVVGKELGRWMLKMLEKYSYKYIMQSIRHACDYENMMIEYLAVPHIFYFRKKAYYDNLLTEEQKKMVEEYIY